MMDADSLLDELAQGMGEHQPIKPGEQLSFDELVAPPSKERLPRHSPETTPPILKINGHYSPVTGRHQDVRLYVTVLLKTFVEMTDSGLVRDAPYAIQAISGEILYPDVVFVSNSHFDRVHDTYVEGPPDIVIEISTPETTAQDRGEKFVAYELLGVREYWLLDSTREMVNFYHLGPDGHFDEFRPDMSGRMNSRVLRGFTLDVDRLWRRVLPTTIELVDMVKAMVEAR